MKRTANTLTVLGLAFAMSVTAKPFVYPADGQTAEQQGKDEYECSQWATGQTGFDPTAPQQTASAPPPQQRRGGAVRGAVVGAAVGEIVDDDWEDGAKAGALLGGVRQSRRNRQQQQAHNQAQQQAAGQQQAAVDSYYKAWGICLEGRGYTVG
ncbi:MAG: hypothetical protein AAGE01_20530 [Pseudomonadota bacterium]